MINKFRVVRIKLWELRMMIMMSAQCSSVKSHPQVILPVLYDQICSISVYTNSTHSTHCALKYSTVPKPYKERPKYTNWSTLLEKKNKRQKYLYTHSNKNNSTSEKMRKFGCSPMLQNVYSILYMCQVMSFSLRLFFNLHPCF